MIRKVLFGHAVVASLAFAQAPAPAAVPSLTQAPTFTAASKLSCPAGTRQVGGPKANLGALACMKFATDGLRIFHGPMVSFYASGKVEAVGQMEEGFRTGKWTFFDEAGRMVGETEFLKGDYHGRRVELLPSGQLKLEEHWVNGKRQGPQKAIDAQGVMTVTEYRDDRPVAK